MAPYFKITTTGTSPSTVILYDLGERTFTHPTVDLDLLLEFSLEEIQNSLDLITAIDAGRLTANLDGTSVTTADQFYANLTSVSGYSGISGTSGFSGY